MNFTHREANADLLWIAGATGARRVDRTECIQLLWSGHGEIYRVELQGAKARTAIVKSVTPPGPRRAGDRSHQRKCASYDVELAWYRGLAARCDQTLLSSCSDDGFDPGEQLHLDRYFAHLRLAFGERAVDVGAVEAEWRALYPIAAADFYRFLAGWAREHGARDAHGQRVVRGVLRTLG